MASVLQKQIMMNSAKVAVIGLGYVGLPLFVEICDSDFPVAGYDIDDGKIDSLRNGLSYISDIDNEWLQDSVSTNSKKVELLSSNQINELADYDIFIVTVPTPVKDSVSPDMSYVHNAFESLVSVLKGRPTTRPLMFVLESTVYPGATLDLYGKLYEWGLDQGFVIGHNLFLSFSPERVDPGNVKFDTQCTPKLVGGIEPESTRLTALFYNRIISAVIETESAEIAEFAKLYENCFRAVNIALANEMAQAASRMGIDIHKVIDAAATKPFGFMKFTPGPGVGGHCIPLDPVYLSHTIKSYLGESRLIDTALDINNKMPLFVVHRILEVLGAHTNKELLHSKVLLLGYTYKKNVNDFRETPTGVIAELLRSYGIEVSISDRFLLQSQEFEHLHTNLSHKNLRESDLVVMLVDHDFYSHEFIINHSKLILDTIGVLDHPSVYRL